MKLQKVRPQPEVVASIQESRREASQMPWYLRRRIGRVAKNGMEASARIQLAGELAIRALQQVKSVSDEAGRLAGDMRLGVPAQSARTGRASGLRPTSHLPAFPGDQATAARLNLISDALAFALAMEIADCGEW